MLDQQLLAIAFLLAVAVNAIVDYLADPIRERFPDFNLWFLPYVAFVIGGAFGFFADINLFEIAPGMAGIPGRVLTAAAIGGGAKLLHNITDHEDVSVS